MTEDFLSFIWKHSYFNTTSLKTTSGEKLIIHAPGILNRNSGPDFDNAKVSIGPLLWRGEVELHLLSSDWDKHFHQTDKAFNTVVLHVVWEDDKPVFREDGTPIPTFQLKDVVNEDLVQSYKKLLSEKHFIPCETKFPFVKRITKLTWTDRLLVQRLERKGQFVLHKYQKNGDDWRQTTFEHLSGVFGIKVNQQAFEDLASKVGYKTIQKHKDHLFQIEALLYGQAGFLEEGESDVYRNSLKKEHTFLSSKFNLSLPLDKSAWKYSRLRPVSFPTLRMAKLAALLSSHSDLFMAVIDVKNVNEVEQWLNFEVSDYWKKHYDFGKKTAWKDSNKGILLQNFIINGVAPLKVAYALRHDQNKYIDEAIALLETLPSEQNSVVKNWKKLGLPIANACDTQGALELYNEYCKSHKCLSCAIGVEILAKNQIV